jgi:hypothetical protein
MHPCTTKFQQARASRGAAVVPGASEEEKGLHSHFERRRPFCHHEESLASVNNNNARKGETALGCDRMCCCV